MSNFRIKIFGPDDSEEFINKWLENNRIDIIEMTQSESTTIWTHEITIIILYKEI